MGDELAPSHHIYRYVGGGSIDGDFIDPAAFRRKMKAGVLEAGVSVNWAEYFQATSPAEAVQLLRKLLLAKNFGLGATAQFALLNVAKAKELAAKYADVSIVLDEQPDDPSHSLITGYAEALNDQVAEQLQKAIIDTFPAKAPT